MTRASPDPAALDHVAFHGVDLEATRQTLDRRRHSVPRGGRAARRHRADLHPRSGRPEARAQFRGAARAIRYEPWVAVPPHPPLPPAPAGRRRPRASRAHPHQPDVSAGRSAQALPAVHRARSRRRPPARAEGIRHRGAGLRQGRHVRSAHRPDRPRAGETAAGQAGALLPRGGTRRRDGDRAAERRLRAGLQAARRSRADQAIGRGGAGQPQHHRGAAVRRPQRRSRPRRISATASGRKSSITWRGSRRCGSWRRTSRAPPATRPRRR